MRSVNLDKVAWLLEKPDGTVLSSDSYSWSNIGAKIIFDEIYYVNDGRNFKLSLDDKELVNIDGPKQYIYQKIKTQKIGSGTCLTRCIEYGYLENGKPKLWALFADGTIKPIRRH